MVMKDYVTTKERMTFKKRRWFRLVNLGERKQ